MSDEDARPFRYDATVDPREQRQFRYEVGETYLGDPVSVPVTIINGDEPGPRRSPSRWARPTGSSRR